MRSSCSRRHASLRRYLRRADGIRDDWRVFIAELGRTVVGQAFEIGPDQGVFRMREGAALAVIELTGQEHEQLPIAALFPLANGRPEEPRILEGHASILVVTSQLATSCGDSARRPAGALATDGIKWDAGRPLCNVESRPHLRPALPRVGVLHMCQPVGEE